MTDRWRNISEKKKVLSQRVTPTCPLNQKQIHGHFGENKINRQTLGEIELFRHKQNAWSCLTPVMHPPLLL